MPQYKDGHTQTGLRACGGFNEGTRKNCIYFYKGKRWYLDLDSSAFDY